MSDWSLQEPATQACTVTDEGKRLMGCVCYDAVGPLACLSPQQLQARALMPDGIPITLSPLLMDYSG